jgi:hypothetical protein
MMECTLNVAMLSVCSMNMAETMGLELAAFGVTALCRKTARCCLARAVLRLKAECAASSHPFCKFDVTRYYLMLSGASGTPFGPKSGLKASRAQAQH